MSNLAIDYIPIDSIDLDFRNPRVAPALEGLREVLAMAAKYALRVDVSISVLGIPSSDIFISFDFPR